MGRPRVHGDPLFVPRVKMKRGLTRKIVVTRFRNGSTVESIAAYYEVPEADVNDILRDVFTENEARIIRLQMALRERTRAP